MKWAVFASGLVLGGLTLWLVYARDADPLTEDAIAAAQERWRARGPANYVLEVAVSGVQEGRHVIHVRRGDVVEMRTGGAAVPTHVWTHWSVDGMLEFLREELRRAGRLDRETVLRAEFDEEYGYPRRFLRHVLGDPAGIEWEVVAFRPR